MIKVHVKEASNWFQSAGRTTGLWLGQWVQQQYSYSRPLNSHYLVVWHMQSQYRNFKLKVLSLWSHYQFMFSW